MIILIHKTVNPTFAYALQEILPFVVKIVAHEDCLDWYLRFKLDPEDPVKCHVDGDKRKGGKTPSFAYGSTGCHQGLITGSSQTD